MKEKPSFWLKLARFIVDRHNLFILLFAAIAVFTLFSRNWVVVNDQLTDYLADDTETRRGLDVMEREFVTFGTADVMVDHITREQADALAPMLEELEGVRSVDYDETERHFASASALYNVTFRGDNDDPVAIEGLRAVEDALSGYDTYIKSNVGNPLAQIINKEMLLVDAISAVIITLVLLFTCKTYGEIPVLLLTFGGAVVANMGTNFLMGEISFVTDSVAIVLQLALAIDYAIIYSTHYTEEREVHGTREAVTIALSKAIPEISASSLTTIAGLAAMCLMEFELGFDMGVVLIKAILLSLLSVFLLMPGLLMLFAPLIDKTHHKSFVPRIDFLGRFAYKTRYVVPVLFAGILVAAYIFSGKANFVFDYTTVPPVHKNEAQIAADHIRERFGAATELAILVPSGDFEEERRLIDEIVELDGVRSVVGLANTEARDGYTLTDLLTPRDFAELAKLDVEVAEVLFLSYARDNGDSARALSNIDTYTVPLIDMFDYLCAQRKTVALEMSQELADELDELEVELSDARRQLRSDSWSRIVVTLDMSAESERSYQMLNILRGITARHYPEFHIAGDLTSNNDMKQAFAHDNVLVSVMSIAFVIAVLIFTFKSVGMSVLLIVIIQGSIWINFSAPYLRGNDLYFLTFLIISAIQMGANIDYAIVIASRYMESKKTMPIREAMTDTLNFALGTILTSGTILCLAGVSIALLTSNETVCAIGVYLGQGTAISMLLVMLVLPQILILGDIIISKTSFNVELGKPNVQSGGVFRIDGNVRGELNGVLIGEVHGIFRGDINASVEICTRTGGGQFHPGETEDSIPLPGEIWGMEERK